MRSRPRNPGICRQRDARPAAGLGGTGGRTGRGRSGLRAVCRRLYRGGVRHVSTSSYLNPFHFDHESHLSGTDIDICIDILKQCKVIYGTKLGNFTAPTFLEVTIFYPNRLLLWFNKDYYCMFQRAVGDERRPALDAGRGGPTGPHSRRLPSRRPQARRPTSAGPPAGGGPARHTHGNTSPIHRNLPSGNTIGKRYCRQNLLTN